MAIKEDLPLIKFMYEFDDNSGEVLEINNIYLEYFYYDERIPCVSVIVDKTGEDGKGYCQEMKLPVSLFSEVTDFLQQKGILTNNKSKKIKSNDNLSKSSVLPIPKINNKEQKVERNSEDKEDKKEAMPQTQPLESLDFTSHIDENKESDEIDFNFEKQSESTVNKDIKSSNVKREPEPIKYGDLSEEDLEIMKKRGVIKGDEGQANMERKKQLNNKKKIKSSHKKE